jgi:CxxC-x17-CxxC domain-containing protein
MGNFNRDNRSNGGRDFGRRDFGSRPSYRPAMHKAICSKCGKACEVPFQPTGNKPVFCRDCFRTNGVSDAPRFEGRPQGFDHRNNNEGKPTEQYNYKEQFAALNIKLDTILKLLLPVAPTVAQEEQKVEKKEEQQLEEKITKSEPKKKVSKKTPAVSL